jgi:hypothetical protein
MTPLIYMFADVGTERVSETLRDAPYRHSKN